jgi:hypothetical protein
MPRMKKALALLGASAALVASFAGPASAAPAKKCSGNAENFQSVGGQCVSDGKAEHL